MQNMQLTFWFQISYLVCILNDVFYLQINKYTIITDTEESDWPNGVPTDEDCNRCTNIHRVLHTLLTIVPMCKELLLQSVVNQFPYFKKSSHIHEYYIHNLLWILDYYPQCRPEIFSLIFSK